MIWLTAGVLGPPCNSSESMPLALKSPFASARYHEPHSAAGIQLNAVRTWVLSAGAELARTRRTRGWANRAAPPRASDDWRRNVRRVG